MGPGKWLRVLGLTLLACVLWPGGTIHATISGTLDFNYSHINTESSAPSGVTTKSQGDAFYQRFRISLANQIFPTLWLSVGGNFDRSESASETDGLKTESMSTRLQPYIDLSLNTMPFVAGGGYRRIEEQAKSNGVSSPTQIRETYSGRIGWQPVDFPTLDVQFSRSSNFDKERLLHDTVNDYLSVSSRYSPAKSLELSYGGTFGELTDRLANSEVRTTIHNGRVSYNDSYLKHRATISASYSVSQLQTEVSASGSGDVSFQASPFFGLAVLSDTPALVTLERNPALIDGNTTAGGGLDLGLPPPFGDARPRNIGLDFINSTEVNTLYVWVDKKLPADIANAFSWEIYTSEDNRSWTSRQTIASAPFGLFDNRFEIAFQNVSARYIKVVTKPLDRLPSPTLDDPDPTRFRSIQVTELQAFLRKSAQSVSGRSSQLSQVLNLDARARLLDVPSLYYTFSSFLTKADTSPARIFYSNALSANHQFSKVFSGSVRVAREDSDEMEGHRVAYSYSSSVSAVPLPALSHTLNYSGKSERFGEKRSRFDSVSLNNSVEFYKGVNAALSHSLSLGTLETGVKSRNTGLNAGLNLIPNRTLNINLSHGETSSRLSGGETPDSTKSTRSDVFAVSFNPVRTLSLSGALAREKDSGQPQYFTRTFSLNWSPFPEGNLHFNFGYSENHRSSDQGTDRTTSPSIRWNISRYVSLDVSYSRSRSDSIFAASRSESFNTNFRAKF